MRKKTNKKIVKALPKAKRTKKSKRSFFTFGNLNPNHGRILVLVVLIILVMTFMFVSKLLSLDDVENVAAQKAVVIKEKTPFEKEIAQMVAGYPIEKMTPYILQQNPKTAMFLVAIAKKESAWGKRKPVLDGKDCYNYWGFRLKAEKMGSGGHTCFDSPKEAVQTVAGRIDQLVQEEEIDTPHDMIVWKCGYGCQDKPKSLSEKKWINDVDFYYSAMNEYL